MNSNNKQFNLKLGTRKSLLAISQSTWVAKQLEKLNPGISVELVGIETKGDQIIDIPLQKVEGKDFFVAELDHALLRKEVDFTVHSMKDLSTERPSEIVLAATPARADMRDIVIFSPEVERKLNQLRTNPQATIALTIGTSSPRRLQNIPPFLQHAFPYGAQGRVKLQFVNLRGNVNTRLSRLHEAAQSEKYLDGVVLALAGVTRLFDNELARKELHRLLTGTRFMVLPLRENPTAPAQGALAIECLVEREDVRKVLSTLHNSEVLQSAEAERAVLKEWGGGCHQALGVSIFHHAEMGQLKVTKGKRNETEVFKTECLSQQDSHIILAEGQKVKPFDSSQISFAVEKTRHYLDIPSQNLINSLVFIVHSRALPLNWVNEFTDETNGNHVWTSGTASWLRLAERGIWVEGCAESLGFDFIRPTLSEPVFQVYFNTKKIIVLTHSSAAQEWAETEGFEFETIATYGVDEEIELTEMQQMAVKKATHFFWTSMSQYKRFKKFISPEAHHSCGPGKTAKHLKAEGLSPQVFYSVEAWRNWLNISPQKNIHHL